MAYNTYMPIQYILVRLAEKLVAPDVANHCNHLWAQCYTV